MPELQRRGRYKLSAVSLKLGDLSVVAMPLERNPDLFALYR
jgi:hypothetical protein